MQVAESNGEKIIALARGVDAALMSQFLHLLVAAVDNPGQVCRVFLLTLFC